MMSTQPRNPEVSAIVLAAGMSRRMGAPKQLLRAGGISLLEHTLTHVRKSTVGDIILVLGFAAEQIREQISTEGLKVVINEAYQEGMASSLRAGIAALAPQTQAALIVLADLPLVRPRTLDRLIEHHRKFHPQIVIPTYKGFRGNPVLLDRSVFTEVTDLRGDIGCRAIFGKHTENIARLEVDDPGIILDVDTRQDFEKYAACCEPTAEPVLPQTEPATARPQPKPKSSITQQEVVVVGRDPVALALVKLARLLGFWVVVIDPFLLPSDVPEANRVIQMLDLSRLPAKSDRYIVIASRGQFDEEALEQALQTEAVYIGLLANSKRSQELRESLRRKGISAERLARMRAPAGLEIGATEPEEIALSIMAEIVAERRRLSERA